MKPTANFCEECTPVQQLLNNPDITAALIVFVTGLGLAVCCLIGGERWPKL